MTTPLAIRTALWLWLIAALVAGRLLLLQRLPMPAVQALIVGLTLALVACYRVSAMFRHWADSIPLRTLVFLHVTRFIGLYFLWLYQKDELPYAFAVPGGVGDIIVATLALVAALAPFAPATRLRAISIWNFIGLIDILMVVVTAARLGLADRLAMRALTYLPLSLLPTFLVPLIIAAHVLIIVRVRREQAACTDVESGR